MRKLHFQIALSLIVLGLIVLAFPSVALAQKNFTFDALMKVQRLSDPQISPDGKRVAFTVQTVDMDKNTKPRQIWMVELAGGAPKQITTQGNNERPRWSPDSKNLVFLSDRSETTQIWQMDADGGNVKAVTNLDTEADGVLFFPDGKHLLFTSEVYPQCDSEDCNKAALEKEKVSKVKARTYTGLLYRHWDQWQSKRRKHLLIVSIDGGRVKDITPGNRDVPSFSLGGPEGYAISPDSQEVCYVLNADGDPSTSTNSDLYTVLANGGDPQRVTSGFGADTGPVYSPDGKSLAWLAQRTAGYEADRWRLMVMDRANGKTKEVTETLDRNVGSMIWSPDSARLFYTVEDRGRQSVQMINVNGGAARSIITGNSTFDDLRLAPDAKTMVYSEQSAGHPPELFKVSSAGGAPVQLTRLNDALLAEYALPPMEEIYTTGAEGAKVHSFILKPAGFDAKKKYPVLFLIHGGPQGAWHENWGYRWNPQVFAGAGFVVVMPNPRGSTGYGQKFTDEINSDWNGKVYEDIMSSVDAVAAKEWADPERFAAAGGSYGGYMVNWMLGHTQRFKAFVSHAGVFDLRSMAGETEEVWFPLWEFKGMPWDNPDLYARMSPSYYVSDFKTPTLVIHGEKDYRVPYGQGLQLYTALQMKKVPSKLLIFPDEGHWVGKPQNSELWYRTFLEWIGEWTREKPKEQGK